MSNKFQNSLDFGGINNNLLPEKIADRSASYCNAIDFSTPGMIKTIGSYYQTLGVEDVAPTGSITGDIFVFKKAYGTYKELLIRSHYNGTNNKLEWFNDNDALNSGLGQWELLSLGTFDNSAGWGGANTNGDGGEAVNRFIMGNGVDDNIIWNGATTRLVSVTANTIVCNSLLSSEGFALEDYAADSSGDYHIIVNGIDFTFTGISNYTFTGVVAVDGLGDPVYKLAHGTIKVGDGVTTIANSRLLKSAVASNRNMSFTLNAGGNYITRDDVGGDFTADGFSQGQRVTVVGFADTDNNKTYTIQTVGTTEMYLVEDYAGSSNEAKGALVTVAAGSPKGNIFLASQGKLFMAGVVGNESKVYYSVTRDITNFSITSGLASGGSFTLMDGGGNITALAEGNSSTVIVHKSNIVIAYTRGTDSNSNVVEDFNTLITGYGVGAINSNCVASYGKQQYFLNGNGEVKAMSQSLYSSALFDFSDIAEEIKDFLSDAVSKYSNQYLVYNSYKKCLVISTNSLDGAGNVRNNLVYIFIKSGTNGNIYDCSIEKIPLPTTAQEVPLVYFSYGNYKNNLIVYFPSTENVYSWMGEELQHLINGRAVYMSKEFNFNEPANDKEFDIMTVDGFIYENTKLKFTVLYGEYGEKGTKVYVIDKSSLCVDQTVIRLKDYNLLGEYSMPFLKKNSKINYSRYFKLPLHIDVNKADRYRVKIETYYSDTVSYVNTFWAINNLSTNPKLKDIDYNALLNQNEIDGYGIGTAVVSDTNTGYSIS